MTIEEIAKIIKANPTNKFIFNNLDDGTKDIIIELLTEVSPNDFKELNSSGKFEFMSLPIPYEKLKIKSTAQNNLIFSYDFTRKMKKLLSKINSENENYEYPALFYRIDTSDYKYACWEGMSDELHKTHCSYNFSKIETLLNKVKDKENFAIALFHTHPNLSKEKYGTLFEKYEKEFAKLGIKPNGLNISLADIYANMYLNKMLKEHNLPQIAESIILMHDGKVVSFATDDGIVLTENKSFKDIVEQSEKIEQAKENVMHI